MALPPTTANWHWKNKNVTRWGKEWFERELVTVSVDGDGSETVKISKVTDVDGDVELGQRKSKLITIYDCHIQLEWEGTASDGTSVKGSLSIPEVSHEITVDKTGSYVYDWSIDNGGSSPAGQALLSLAKTRLVPLLEEAFSRFPVALIDTHGKDLTVSAEPSRSGTPNPASTKMPAASSSTPSAPAKPKVEAKTAVNTTTVETSGNFMASAEDLFGLLTDEKRIPSWTRAPAQSSAQPGSEYSLFAGGVKGKYVSLNPGKEIVQTWALQSPTWPAGHTATLTTTLNQSSDSTKLTLSLSGVPTGMEEDVRRNVEGYYIHGLKSIGLGSVL